MGGGSLSADVFLLQLRPGGFEKAIARDDFVDQTEPFRLGCGVKFSFENHLCGSVHPDQAREAGSLRPRRAPSRA